MRPLLPFLLLVLIGAHTPLPQIPDMVYGRLGPVQVAMVPVVNCPQPPFNVTPPNVIGCYSAQTRIIQIADTLSAEYAWFVLYHEQVHVAARDEGVQYTGQLEEMYATVTARYRLGEMLAR